MIEEVYTGPERRKDMRHIQQRLDDGQSRMDGFEALLKQNTEITQKTAESVARIETNTAGFIEFTNELMGGAKLLCRVARGIQWGAEMIKSYWAVVCFISLVYAYATNQFNLLDRLISILKP